MNAWLFVHTEEIPGALKPYRDLQKELKLEDNDFTGAVFEGRFFTPEEFKVLESMPTRLSFTPNCWAPFKALPLALSPHCKPLPESLWAHFKLTSRNWNPKRKLDTFPY